EMCDLPAADRQRLASTRSVLGLSVLAEERADDGVVKLLLDGGDGQGFEAVLLPFDKRVSCCLSSQVGCAMGCQFCATGLSGFDRNLSTGEIVAQYLLLQTRSARRISHVVFMGMGEPMHNYDAVLGAIRLLNEHVGVSMRHITVSTVGIVPGIERLGDERLPIHLAISLHSPFDSVRSELIPANKRWGVAEVVEAGKGYFRKTGRKVTFEYLLIDQVTDSVEQAEELARLIHGFPCIVNLIPFNPVPNEHGFRSPKRARARAFRQALEACRVKVTQRVERGQSIAAACGQLKGMHTGRFGKGRQPFARVG
ncbi:MAG: 23S rRNA (adenine(2503)-C(2))-methyltransferase RlmN, partial [Armatimonadota bacterium]